MVAAGACFLFAGGGARVLVNPFRPLGCTAGYRSPKVPTDLILISSRLLDEGAIDGFSGNPGLLYEPGAYKSNGLRIQGIRTKKTVREEGDLGSMWLGCGSKRALRFYTWAELLADRIEEQILIGRPDVVLIPVGGA